MHIEVENRQALNAVPPCPGSGDRDIVEYTKPGACLSKRVVRAARERAAPAISKRTLGCAEGSSNRCERSPQSRASVVTPSRAVIRL